MSKLSDDQVKVLRGKHLADLATVNSDGFPQVTPVGVDTDGEAVIMTPPSGA